MRNFLVLIIIFLSIGALYFISRSTSKNRNPELVIYSYSSFANSWGAGPQVIQKFQDQYNVKVSLNDIGDARTILQRLDLEKKTPQADLVIGLDHLILNEAKDSLDWYKIKISDTKYSEDFPEKKILFDYFVPFDWAPMTFIYREGELPPPRTLFELQAMNYGKKIVLYDPRSSSPGYILIDWLVRALGISGAKQYLSELEPNVLTVTSSWSAGYGLFQKKQAGVVFSYVTSPVYHWKKEGDLTYKASPFEDPVPYHIEYAAIPRSCNQCDLAQEFLKFILLPDVQKTIMETNFMYPVIEGVRNGTDFDKLPKLKLIPQMLAPDKKSVLEVWESLTL